jgi:hypothetical protein
LFGSGFSGERSLSSRFPKCPGLSYQLLTSHNGSYDSTTEVKVKVTLRPTVSRPVHLVSSPICCYSQAVAGLLTWCALSDERTGMSGMSAGHRLRSHSQVRVWRDSWPYFNSTNPEGQVFVFISTQEQGGPVILLVLGPFTSPPTVGMAMVEALEPTSTRGELDKVNLRPTVSRPVLSLWRLRDSWCGAPSLTRGWACNLLVQLLLGLAKIVTLGSKSCRTHNHTFTVSSETPPTWMQNSQPYFYCIIWDSPNLELELELFLRPTVSRPVRLGIGPPFGTLDQMLSCTWWARSPYL